MIITYETREYVVYSPELDLFFVSAATIPLNNGIYYKMFNRKRGEFIVVLNLGAL
jgi:hypothetical protein